VTVLLLVRPHKRPNGPPRRDTGSVTELPDEDVSVLKATMNPRSLSGVGDTPDYRFSLANERTFLAWLRTALALTGGGLAVAQFLPRLPIAGLRETIAVALLLLGAACALRAVVHWAACERAMRLRRDLPASRFPASLALLVFLGALVLLATVAVELFT
jgi:putative membrane protein